MNLKFRWYNALIRIFAANPKTLPVAGAMNKGGKVLDKAADESRKRRKSLVDDIRRGGSMTVLCLVLALSGCTSAKQLRSEGYELTRWQSIQLGFYDIVIKADDIKDYEIVIGDDDATPTGER